MKKAAKATTKAIKNAVQPKNLLNTLQVGLDLAGLIPVVGEVADGLYGIIYAARGDKLNASLSFVAMIPVAGNAATAGKWINKGANATKDIAEGVKNANKSAGTAGKNTPSSNPKPSNSSNAEPKKVSVDEFNADKATNKQKGNFGEIISSDNLLNNQSIKAAGYDLKPIGRGAPTSTNDKIVKGIDGLYENANKNSSIKYVIDEAKFGSSQLGKTKDGPQMSNDWLTGAKTEKSRILKAVGGDQKLANKITKALDEDEVERVLSKVDSSGNVITYRLNAKGEIIGEWP